MRQLLRVAAVCAACLAVALAPDGGGRVLADEARGAALPQVGAEGTLVTALQGSGTQEIPVTFIGTYKDFAGPGYDVHLVRLEGPEAERIGVAAGMSGSPVYFDGKVIGALAYRLGLLPKVALGGVTPIDDMYESVRSGPPPTPPGVSGLAPIATPVLGVGLAAGARDWLSPRLEELGLQLVAGGAAGGSTAPDPFELVPGSPVGVELLRGDMTLAATGTVTLVEDGLVYAFGHPFLGDGRVAMPMVQAEVIHTLADLAGSVKLSNVGPELGAVVEDRRAAIVGQLGQRAPMVPLDVAVSGGDYGEERYRFELVRNADLAPLLSAVAVLNSLQASPGYSREATLMLTGTVRLAGLPDLPVEMAFAGSGATDPSLASAAEILSTLGAVWRNPFAEVEVEGMELQVEARSEIVSYRIEEALFDRDALRPGETLDVRCVLRRYRGDTISRDLSLRLPDRIPGDGNLVLAVGSPRGIDRALGGTLAQRLQSAVDPASYIEILADLGSARRLTAIVYEQGGAVVARGSSYARLPPTAERLLATQSSTARRRAPQVSPLSRAGQELDGPVTGMLQVRLRVDRQREARESR